MNKNEIRELAQARMTAGIMPDYAARIIGNMRRATRNNVCLAATMAAIIELKLEGYFVPGTNYMVTP